MTLRQISSVSEAGLADELEMLQNIYMEQELRVTSLDSGVTEVCMHITPSTGGDMEKKYLYLDLCLKLGTNYPKEAAVAAVRASRGLSDARLRHIMSSLEEKGAELRGCPMLFELVEVAKESLTEQNLPSDNCSICLLHFQEGEECTRTDCYHYFHVSCLASYICFSRRQQEEEERVGLEEGQRSRPSGYMKVPAAMSFLCPVCREVLEDESACLVAVSRATPPPLATPESETAAKVVIEPEVRAWQKKMAALLDQQRRKGGLIDLQAKDEVIDETWVRPKPVLTEVPTNLSKEEEGEAKENMAGGHTCLDKTNATGSSSRSRRKVSDRPTFEVDSNARGRRKCEDGRVSSRSGGRWKDRKKHWEKSLPPSDTASNNGGRSPAKESSRVPHSRRRERNTTAENRPVGGAIGGGSSATVEQVGSRNEEVVEEKCSGGGRHRQRRGRISSGKVEVQEAPQRLGKNHCSREQESPESGESRGKSTSVSLVPTGNDNS